MKKIKSGIFGLNPLLDGGLNEKSTNVIIGTPGTGKTTFATQYIKRGLEMGQIGIFISLDENEEQIVHEATERGWPEIKKFVKDGLLLFIDASGQEFTSFIHDELPAFVTKWEGANARIAIDPLTPVVWAAENRYDQRELISILMKELKKIGTVVCTLEEYASGGELADNETIIPLYLADSVIHLQFVRKVGQESTEKYLEIIKCRNSRHSKLTHRYNILHGFGIILEQNYPKKKISRKVPRILEQDLMNDKKIPKETMKKFLNYLKSLKDNDFEDLDTSTVLKNIKEEYS